MYFKAQQPSFLESDVFKDLVGDDRLWVVDGGARGELFEPFCDLKGIGVIAFEPDGEAEESYGDESTEFIRVNKALWNQKTRVPIHLAVERSTSSVYPPNMKLLGEFKPIHGTASRTTDCIEQVDAISIDAAVEEGLCPSPDFVKLDVHSAEFEALEGAKQVLDSTVVGVLVETWHCPVHAGQKLHSDVEQLLNQHGFYLFDLRHAAKWKHSVDDSEFDLDRSRHVGSEALFIKTERKNETRKTAVFKIAVADLFGHSGYAILLARQYGEESVLSKFDAESAEDCLRQTQQRRRKNLTTKTKFKQLGKRILNAIRTPRGR